MKIQFDLLETARREHAAKLRRDEFVRNVGAGMFMGTLWVGMCIIGVKVLDGFFN